MPVLVEMNMSFGTYCALFMLPGWNEIMSLPVPERIEKLCGIHPDTTRMLARKVAARVSVLTLEKQADGIIPIQMIG